MTSPGSPQPGGWSVLVYTRTAGYRHDSIPDAVRALVGLGGEHGFTVEATEDPAAFTAERLARHRAVVFLSTTGTVLDGAGREALSGYVRDGGGWMGVHSAAGTEYDWPYYGELLGARFTEHPAVSTAAVTVLDHDHPATAHLGDEWTLTDEWYNFRQPPPASARILLGIDESRYGGGTMGPEHPLAWCREYGGGRSFYTSLGHTSACWDAPDFRQHVLGGLNYAAGTTS